MSGFQWQTAPFLLVPPSLILIIQPFRCDGIQLKAYYYVGVLPTENLLSGAIDSNEANGAVESYSST